MSLANAVAKSFKQAVVRPSLAGRRSSGWSSSRRSFSSSTEFSCVSAEFLSSAAAAPPSSAAAQPRFSPLSEGRSPRSRGGAVTTISRERLSATLGRALAPSVGEYSPLADAVHRIRQLRFSSTASSASGSSSSPRSRAAAAASDKHAARMASRAAFRASIIDRCSLSPP
eukprot:CAMPEP_0197185888 /NCGR_PEP_ID=MMETSP1423-20130617/12857_1 /TAXON_ID=476441 /ORGANISM="Pseudo-nitzschia heimii, Strain UNC1101" /LENGTH=169 /DNA_ID=CAMNT_0042637057 /DNA_START=237 /DNA_END=749 /DNA_ORIENTATION=+